jgi:hypothetical protein
MILREQAGEMFSNFKLPCKAQGSEQGDACIKIKRLRWWGCAQKLRCTLAISWFLTGLSGQSKEVPSSMLLR